MMQHINALAGDDGIGPRVAGSPQEREAAEYINTQFLALGLSSKIVPFDAVFRGQSKKQASQNVVATLNGKTDDLFIIGAHYDSVAATTKSQGVIDNAASVAMMLTLAQTFAASEKLEHTFVFIAFGAEEVGLNGAKDYAYSLDEDTRGRIKGMLNLDSITGGDKLYIHSALSSGYACNGDKTLFSANPIWRDALLQKAGQLTLPFHKHPGTAAFPPGETASWSDHSPFACVGIPIAYIEATNFTIDGEGGKDGYSQTLNSAFWDCLDVGKSTACNRENETKWGKIWHTQFDSLEVLEKELPGRLQTQLNDTYSLLSAFFADY